jgi:hypothetical protein
MSDISDLIAKMKKEEQELKAKMVQNENDVLIQLLKCFASHLKLLKRTDQELFNLVLTLNNSIKIMEMLKESMIADPYQSEFNISWGQSDERTFQNISAIFETRGDCYDMNIKIP